MRVAPVSNTAQSQLLQVARKMTEPEGSVLFRRSEPAFGVFMVQRGSISLRLEDEEGKPLWDRTVTRESIIGLPATISGGRYSLTAVTLEDCELAFIGREALIDLIKGDPRLGLELMRGLGDEVLQMRAMLATTLPSV